MKKWKARYKVIKAKVSDPSLIENADRIVRKAIEISLTTGQLLPEVLEAMWITLERLNRPFSTGGGERSKKQTRRKAANSVPERRKHGRKHPKIRKT